MRKIMIYSLVAVFALSAMTVSANERDFDTIDNAPEEKERGMSAEQWGKLTGVLRDTPNGDKVMRILKRKLPGIID